MHERLREPVLSIDSSGPRPSAALLTRASGGTEREAPDGARASAVLHELLAELTRDAKPRSVVVVRGPGSFTGLRVGLAAAAGLSLAWDVPAFGVDATAALAWAGGTAGTVGVLIAGGQGRYFVAAHERGEGLSVVVEPQDATPDEARELLDGRCDAVLARGAVAPEILQACSARPFDGPLARSAGELALLGLSCAPATASYLRAPTIRPRPAAG